MKYKAIKLTDEEIEILAGHKPIKAKTLVKKIKDMNNKSGDCLDKDFEYYEGLNKRDDKAMDFKDLKVEYDIKVDTKNNDTIYTDKTLPDFEDGALDLPRKNKGFFYTCSDEQLKYDLQDKPVEIEKLEEIMIPVNTEYGTSYTFDPVINKINEIIDFINDHQI